MKHIILSAALIATASLAQAELSRPIVAYTPIVMKNADALNLTDAQRADVAQWKATMPAKRKAVEDETIALRAKLRKAINEGQPTQTRQALAEQIGARETQLLMMRSNCVDHWRALLSEDQFAKMLELAGAGQ